MLLGMGEGAILKPEIGPSTQWKSDQGKTRSLPAKSRKAMDCP